ncbi:2990_t:CDS:2 [Entrophospora sp. SA101]|nr:2990_t:CDS:2 [Entrophospora sp. SA101]
MKNQLNKQLEKVEKAAANNIKIEDLKKKVEEDEKKFKELEQAYRNNDRKRCVIS